MSSTPVARFLDRTTPPHIATLILIAGIGALNMSIFLPSLNRMALYFNADYAVMQLAVSGYLAATAVLQIAIGPISDRFGRRPVLIGALALFILATLGALFAPSVGWFLAFRMLQAAVATGLVLSRAIVRDMYPPAQSASQIGYVTMGMAVIPMVGPMFGGLLEQIWDWHATFLFLAIAGAGVLALVIADGGETLKGKGMSFAEQARGYPVLFSSRRFWGYVMCAAFGSGAFFALLGAASLIAGTVFQLSPLWTGVALGTPAIGYAFGNYLSGRFSVRVGIDRMVLAGTLVSSFGMALSIVLTLAGLIHPLAFFGCCVFLGLGNGLMLPNATAGSLSVRPDLAGTASGLGGAIMIGGGAVMSAFAGALQSTDAGTLPLQVIMLVTSLGGVGSILFVMRRARQLGL
jgi:DHA1 family bicyclomycin/chloramphenicol resistance-like MFS transporter